MRNQGLIVIGLVLIATGLMFLLGNLFNVNLMAFCLPVLLIGLGFFLLVRPRMVPAGTRSDVLLIGDMERTAPWDVVDEELWSFVGDIKYDLTNANVPKGQTTIKLNGFVSDIDLVIPKDIAATVTVRSFVTSFNAPSQDESDNFLAPVRWHNKAATVPSTRQVRFELAQFVADITIHES